MIIYICKHNVLNKLYGGNTMKKAELVEAVATAAGLTKADATRAIDAVFATPLNSFNTSADSFKKCFITMNPFLFF
mgnify:CR=1 FL=1